MLHSMTGFARASAEAESGVLTCELRAVNHRYFDVQFRLPEELRGRESDLRQLIAGRVRRGKVDCTVHYRRALGGAGEIRLNRALVEQLGERAREIAGLLPEVRALDPLDILRWPGVVEEPVVEADPLYELALQAVAGALEALADMRASEGHRIAAMLDSRCRELLDIAESVRARLPDVLAAVRTRQKERLDRLDVTADPARLETELALVAQKLDVDEELDRLVSHVSEIRLTLDSGDAVGRRLDFLMQELNREANTLGAKSADAGTSRAAVDMKVLIEQMREQIQNVE